MADELLTLGANTGTNVTNKVYEEHTVSGAIATFPDGADDVPLKKCEITLPASLDGYSEINVVSAGKNLLPNTAQTATENGVTYTANSDGTVSLSGTCNADTNFYIYSGFTFPKLGQYFFSGCPSGGSTSTYRVFLTNYGADVGNGYLLNVSNLSTTTSIRINIKSGVVTDGLVFKPQLEVGSSVSDYEPYAALTTHTAQLGRTIYGGTADVVNGVGKDSIRALTISGNVAYYGTYGTDNAPLYYWEIPDYTTIPIKPVGSSISTNLLMCSDIFSRISTISSADMKNKEMRTQDAVIPQRLYFRWDEMADVNAINTYLESNPITVLVELATPTDFTFTCQEVPTRLGNNTIWSEQGTNVEVTYYSEREVINNYNVTATQLTAIADAIREKKGTTNPILFEDFPDEIRTIETGGGGGVKSVEWVYTAGINGSGSTYNYTAVEAGLYLAVAVRYQSTGCSISLPDGGTTVLTSSLSSNRLQLKVVQVEANQRIQMGIYDSSHSRGGWIFKLNVMPNAVAYSRGTDSYGDQSFANQGTSNTVLSVICSTGTNKFCKWDKTMECYITSPLTAAAHIQIMYGVDMAMPTVVKNGPVTGHWILSLAED